MYKYQITFRLIILMFEQRIFNALSLSSSESFNLKEYVTNTQTKRHIFILFIMNKYNIKNKTNPIS